MHVKCWKNKSYLLFLWTSIKKFWVRDWVSEIRLQQIQSQSCRWLVCHLHTVLENGHWKLGTHKEYCKTELGDVHATVNTFRFFCSVKEQKN